MEKENVELKKKFQESLETSRRFMEPIHKLMDYYYEIYRNRWNKQDSDFKVSDLMAYVETVVPILTNNRVRASVKAEFPEYTKHAEGMGYILDHVFDTNNWDYEAQSIARMAEIYRSGLAYSGFDPDANNGTGKLTVIRINPRWCYFDPAVTQLEDSSFFFYTEPMRLSKIKKMYPDKAKKLEQKKGSNVFSSEKDSSSWFKSLFKSISSALSFVGNNKAVELGGAEYSEEDRYKNSIAFIHFWYRDDNDQWRVSYWADDILLEDTENPFWHGKLPYDIYSPTEDILSALGIPMAEHIEYLNAEKNVLMDTIVKHAKKSVKPPRIYNTTMGIKDPRQLRENDELIPIANPDFVPLNALVADLQPAPMPAFADALPDRFDMIMDKVTGVNDSFRGMSQATSGKEVQLKQEAAYTRIKTKVDNFEKFTKSIAEKVIVNAMQFIDSTRPFRVKGDYKRFESMINQDETPFMVEPIPQGMNEAGEPQFDKQEFFLYANPNEWTMIEQQEDGKGEEQAKEAFRILQLVVEIEAGSSLPTSRQARREEAMELFTSGAIDQQALLEAFDYPKAEEIMKRMSEQAMMQQQAEMNAQLQQMQQQQMMPPQEQPMPEQPQTPDLSSQLDMLRQQVPEIAQMSDDEIIQLLAGMNQQGGAI